MIIKFEPSGTHVHREQLKIRLDLYAEPSEKSYAQNYIYVPVFPVGGYPGAVNADGTPKSQKAYDNWLAGLPHIWQLNPSLSVFVAVGQDITKSLLTQFVGDILKSDVLATIDDAMIQANSAHLISPYMNSKAAPKSILSTAKTTTFDDNIKMAVNAVLADFAVGGEAIGTIESIQPQSIDVGPGATNRGTSNSTTNRTYVELGNPSNATGTLDTMETFFVNGYGDGAGVKIGTFYGSSTNYTSRDYETIGAVTQGSKQTFTGLSCNVTTDDFLGFIFTGGRIERDSTGGSGCYSKIGDQFGAGTQTYGLSANVVDSIYATGTEAGGGWTHIGKVNGVAASAIAKINGVAVASIAKINGVAV